MRLLTDRVHDGWANVLARGGTFTWETWEPSDANGDSMSHGWGATVLVAVQEALLGVTPTGPGFASVAVRPPTSGLDRAAGTIPTARGAISVSWSRTGDAFGLHLVLPANVRATVSIPATAAAGVTEGGRRVRARMDGDLAVVTVGSGTYDFRSAHVPRRYAARRAGVSRAAPTGPSVAGSPPTTTTAAVGGRRARVLARGRRSGGGGHRRAPLWLVVPTALVQLGLLALLVPRLRRRQWVV